MSEDHTMDKKNRSTQGANKGNGSESKKSQDVTTSKQFPKQRRREPAGSIKNDASGRGKMLPQKFKSFDKRPKPRGGVACGKESTKINFYDGDEPELGSLYSPGSKKQNLNHLLNFQYASPSSHYGSGGGRNSYTTRSHGNAGGYNNYLMQSLASVHKHKYNKEQFLQANCQFVVRAGEDYTVHLGDPDTLVKWEFIQQIRGFGNEDIKCPICLDLPRAPQLTRCGHCFCWPCILHYLALSDKSWRKCPICYEAVHLNDLKSFRSVMQHPRAVNEVVTFQLMKRERGSMMVSPVAQWELHATDKLMNVSETHLDTLYAKLLSATLDDILEMIKLEEDDLTLLLEELKQEQCPTLCFTERALELLQNRRLDVLAKMGGTRKDSKKIATSPDISTIPTEETLKGSGNHQQNEAEAAVVSTGTTADNDYIKAEQNIDTTQQCGEQGVDPGQSGVNDSKLPESSVRRNHLDSEESAASRRTISTSSVDSALSQVGTGHDSLDCSMSHLGHDNSSMSQLGTGHDAQDCSLSMSPHSDTGYDTHEMLDTSAHYATMDAPHSGGGNQPSRFFYFYQATDGQQLFLHAVNVRMLEMTYGSLELCPPTIQGRILEKETGSMTEDLRRRLRYLQHLPVTCQFEVAEIDLKPPLISDDTMDRYRDQLVSRERRRLKRAREDKRRAARIEEAEYVQMRGGRVGVGMSNRRRGNLHIESHYQFPECGVGGVPGLDSSALDYSTESSRASSPRRPDSPLTTAVLALSLEEHNQQVQLQQQNSQSAATTSSFAQRLRAGSSLSAEDNSIFWPSVGETDGRRRTLSEDSNTLPTLTSGSFTPSLPTPAPDQGESQASEQGGGRGASNVQGGGGGSNGQGGAQNKKKKRKQQTLLFATGGMKVNK